MAHGAPVQGRTTVTSNTQDVQTEWAAVITDNLMRNSTAVLRYEHTSGVVVADAAFRAGYSVALADIGEAARPGAPMTLTLQFADVADAESFLTTANELDALDIPANEWDRWQRFTAALRATIERAAPVPTDG